MNNQYIIKKFIFILVSMIFVNTSLLAVTFTPTITDQSNGTINLTTTSNSWAIYGADGNVDTKQEDGLGDNVYEKKSSSTIFDTPSVEFPSGCNIYQADDSEVKFSFTDGTNTPSVTEDSFLYIGLGPDYPPETKCSSYEITVLLTDTTGNIDFYIKNFKVRFSIEYFINGSSVGSDRIESTDGYKKVSIDIQDAVKGSTLVLKFNSFGVDTMASNLAILAARSTFQQFKPLEISGGDLSGHINVLENTTAVDSITATGSGAITFSLSGTDGDKFEITGSPTAALAFKSPPDYEAPTDADTNNIYNVIVTATNGSDSASYNLSVLVKNVMVENITPVAGTGTHTVDENSSETITLNTTTTSASDADGDNLTFTPATITCDAVANIALKGEQTLSTTAYSVNDGTETVTDGSFVCKGTYTDDPAEWNTPPENQTWSSSGVNTYNWASGANDPDTVDTITYSYQSGQDSEFMSGTTTISGNPDPDTDAGKVVTINVRASATGDIDKSFTITIGDAASINDIPTAADNAKTLNEDTNASFSVADFNFADADRNATLDHIVVVSAPSYGSLKLNGSDLSDGDTVANADIEKLTYIPNLNHKNDIAIDNFTFKVNDAYADSASSYTMTLNVTNVNDAPVVESSNDVNLTTITEDELTNTGNTVSELISQMAEFSDVDDTSTGSNEGVERGIAIYASSITPLSGGTGSGTWQYSVDTTNWVDFPALSTTTALLLENTDKVRFVPDGKNGLNATISFYGWDKQSGSAGSTVDVTTRGSTTPYSLVEEVANISVTSLNDKPIIDLDSGGLSVSSIGEITGSTTKTSVFNVQGSDVAIGASVDIADSDDGSSISYATIILTDPLDEAYEKIYINSSDLQGLSVTNNNSHSLTLTGNASHLTYEEVFAKIYYTNTSNTGFSGTRHVDIVVNDGKNNIEANHKRSSSETTVWIVENEWVPVIDLDEDDSFGDNARDFNASYTEDGSPIAISDTDVEITDLYGDGKLKSLVVQVLNPQDGDELSLSGALNGSISSTISVDKRTLTITGVDFTNYYSDAIRKIRYKSTSQNPSEVLRNITLYAVDNEDNNGLTTTATINVTAENDAPVVDTNVGLTVAESATGIIGNTKLSANDVDDDNTILVYKITLSPQNGRLLKGGSTELGIGSTFTQAEIDANAISYSHFGDENTADSFKFSVKDDQNATTAVSTFAITVNSQNDTPVITNTIENQYFSSNSWSFTTANNIFNDAETSLFTLSANDGDYGWLSVIDNNNNTLTYTGTSIPYDVDNVLIKLTATDESVSTVTTSFYLVRDTDNDGIADSKDSDSDNDTIADEIEGNADTDSDGIPNYLDLDSDGDTILDSVELNIDTDNDGTPNYLDTNSDGDSRDDSVELLADDDGDGVPNYVDVNDAVEVDDVGNVDDDNDGILDTDEGAPLRDTDKDGTPDYKDTDSDGDTILDSVELGVDTDNDGIADFIDLDSDNDGIADSIEGTIDTDSDSIANYIDLDSDGDTKIDSQEGTGDIDGDGIANYIDADDTTYAGKTATDSDGDGISDIEEGSETNVDTDNDGIPDYLDLDSDNDSKTDKDEGTADTDSDSKADFRDVDEVIDSDNDGIANDIDTDDDNDGILDTNEGFNNTPPTDTDLDTIPDYLDLDSDNDGYSDKNEGEVDTDGDGTKDFRDTDSDNDGILDADEGSGDEDGDNIPNRVDFNPYGTSGKPVVADNYTYSGEINTTISFNWIDATNATDADGDTLSAIVSIEPSKGMVTISNEILTYYPDANIANGATDSLTLIITDNDEGSAAAVITFNNFDTISMAPTITYTGSFEETATNDGTIEGTITASITGDTFATGSITATNLPSGLSVIVNIISSTKAEISLSGNALSHGKSASVSNLTLTFNDGAFTNTGTASDISGYQKNDASILFYDLILNNLIPNAWQMVSFSNNYVVDTSSLISQVAVGSKIWNKVDSVWSENPVVNSKQGVWIKPLSSTLKVTGTTFNAGNNLANKAAQLAYYKNLTENKWNVVSVVHDMTQADLTRTITPVGCEYTLVYAYNPIDDSWNSLNEIKAGTGLSIIHICN